MFQACSEATYNSVLNVEALKEATRLKPSLIILKATKDEKFQFRFDHLSSHLSFNAFCVIRFQVQIDVVS